MTNDLIKRLKAIPGVSAVEDRVDGIWVLGDAIDVEAMAREMNALSLRLGTMTAIPLDNGETTVIYHYASLNRIINVKTLTRKATLASVASLTQPANWHEREIKDLYAVNFPNHPNLIPLMRPAGHDEGMFREPMCTARAQKAAAKKA